MAKLMKGLGRGLEALLAETRSDEAADSLRTLPVTPAARIRESLLMKE